MRVVYLVVFYDNPIELFLFKIIKVTVTARCHVCLWRILWAVTVTFNSCLLRNNSIDLGAEELVAAEKRGRQIAVEIKSFVGPSEVEDLKNALGANILYHDILAKAQPQRSLYLAIREEVYYALFEEPIGSILLENQRVQLLIFDPEQEIVIKWIE